MQAQGDSGGFDIPMVSGGIVIVALLGLILMNRLTVNVSLGR